MSTASQGPGFATGESLTAVIVNYRTPQLVLECVDHLKRFPATGVAMHIVVVDNGSGDDSPTLIKAGQPDTTVIDAGTNLGFAKGNNLALRDLATDYALLINSDALVEAGTLDAMIAAFRAEPTVGMVGPRVVNADDGADQDYPDRFPSVAQMIRRAVAGPQFPARDHDTPVEIERIHGACLMTRAVVLRQIGLLDEDFFMYDEDVDWCIRARKAGWRLLLLPNARVRHYGGKTSGRMPSGQRARVPPGEGSLRMRYELRRSRYLLYRKHRSAAETALLKLITDSALVADSALWLLRALASHESRAACLAVLRWNLRIIRLNPFGLRTTS